MSSVSSHFQQRGQRTILWIVGATVVMIAAAILGSVVLMLLAARTLDHIESLDERALIQRTIARDLKRMTRELTSATVWDDAVKAFAGPVDNGWVDVNFAEYYSKYFGYDVTFVVRDGAIIYASKAGARAPSPAVDQLARDASTLIGRVDGRARVVHAKDGHSVDGVSTASGLVRSGGDIYLVVASDVLAETAPMAALDRRSPAVVVSARRADLAYVQGLREDLGIEGLILAPHVAASEIEVDLHDPDGTLIGVAAWPPREPGMSLLRHAAPWLGAVFAALVGCASILFLRVGEALRRLEANRLALIEAKEAAEAANIAKTRFLALMGHEIRTPLNGVLGMAQVMQIDSLSDQQRDRLGVIQDSGQALLALLNDILDMARLEGRSLPLRVEPFDVSQLVEDVRALFAGAATSRGVALNCDVHPACHGAWLGDPIRLRQILSNLIANAVKFTDRGGVGIRVSPAAEGLRFEIEDTGAGIAPEDISCLFQMFSQVDASSTRRHEGSGLGLAISYQLVSLMGGIMGVNSTLGVGSNFFFEAPLRRSERPQADLKNAGANWAD